MAFIAAKKGEIAEEEGVGKGGVVGAGVGAMEANTWCTRSHDGHWGWVGGWGGRGPGMAMRGREEERAVGPSQELLEVVGRWAASLVAQDGRNQLEGLNGGTGGMATWQMVWAQEMECRNGVAGRRPALGLGL